MNRIIFILAILMLNGAAIAQKEDNIWLMSSSACRHSQGIYSGKVELNFSLPEFDTNAVCKYHGAYHYAYGSICDTSGKIFMYSNGYRLYDSTGVMMSNGDDINFGNGSNNEIGEMCQQAMLMLHQPGSDSLIYIIHEAYLGLYNPNPNDPNYYISLNSLYYSIVNTKLNNGRGGCILKNQPLIIDTLALGGLTACKHANGRDWWIIMPDQGTNRYYRILLDPQGIHVLPFQNIGAYPNPLLFYDRADGQAVFTPNGQKYIYSDNGNGTYIFDFDRCTGMLSNPIHFVLSRNIRAPYTGGISVSNNSKYMYIGQVWVDTSNYFISFIDQFDLDAPNIFASRVQLDSLFGICNPAWAQLAPNGKIYTVNSQMVGGPMSIIQNPNLPGIKCKFDRNILNFNDYIGQGINPNIPNFPNFRLGPLDGFSCDTLGLDAAIAEQSVYELNFDTVHVGLSKTLPITIHNSGLKDLHIKNPYIYATGLPFSFSPAAPVVTIHGGDSIVYHVTFRPTIAIDTFAGELRLPNDGDKGGLLVSLSGISLRGYAGINSSFDGPVSYHVYPNPAQESFTLGTTGAFDLNSRVVLSNMLGQVVLQQDLPAGWNKYNVSLGQVPVGVYACTIVSGYKVEQVIKLLKQL